MSGVLLHHLLPYSSKTQPPALLEGRLVSASPGDFLSLPSRVLKLQKPVAIPSFSCGFWVFEFGFSCLHSKISSPLNCLPSPHLSPYFLLHSICITWEDPHFHPQHCKKKRKKSKAKKEIKEGRERSYTKRPNILFFSICHFFGSSKSTI